MAKFDYGHFLSFKVCNYKILVYRAAPQKSIFATQCPRTFSLSPLSLHICKAPTAACNRIVRLWSKSAIHRTWIRHRLHWMSRTFLRRLSATWSISWSPFTKTLKSTNLTSFSSSPATTAWRSTFRTRSKRWRWWTWGHRIRKARQRPHKRRRHSNCWARISSAASCDSCFKPPSTCIETISAIETSSPII